MKLKGDIELIIGFSEEQKSIIRQVTNFDPEEDLSDDDLAEMIEQISEDIQLHGISNDEENERGTRDANLITWIVRNTD